MTAKEQLDQEQTIVLNKLSRLAEQRKRTEAEVKSLRRQQDELVLAGFELGIPKLTLSETARLTRQTIYGVVLRAKATA